MLLAALRCPALEVPHLTDNFAYGIFRNVTCQGVGDGRPAAAPISKKDRFNKRHCGRCMKPLPEASNATKALHKGAWYWACATRQAACASTEVWKCPTAAKGKRGCKCCCGPKQAAPSRKRKAGGKCLTSSKKETWKKRTMDEFQKGKQ